MKKIGVIIIACAMLIALTGVVMADRVVPATPETQGIVTTTVINVDGLVMESASGVMTLTDNPYKSTQISGAAGLDYWISADAAAQLTAAGGSFKGTWNVEKEQWDLTQITVPDSLSNVQVVGGVDDEVVATTWGSFASQIAADNPTATVTTLDSGIHTGILNTGQVQYTTSYDKNIVAQNGQTSL
ncbi:MAG: hypothetical protein WCJ93_12205, partial [Methanomicrobiales archaeon]